MRFINQLITRGAHIVTMIQASAAWGRYKSMFFFHDGHPKRRQTSLCFFLVGVRLRNARRKKHHLLVGFPVFLQDFSIAFSYL